MRASHPFIFLTLPPPTHTLSSYMKHFAPPFTLRHPSHSCSVVYPRVTPTPRSNTALRLQNTERRTGHHDGEAIIELCTFRAFSNLHDALRHRLIAHPVRVVRRAMLCSAVFEAS